MFDFLMYLVSFPSFDRFPDRWLLYTKNIFLWFDAVNSSMAQYPKKMPHFMATNNYYKLVHEALSFLHLAEDIL